MDHTVPCPQLLDGLCSWSVPTAHPPVVQVHMHVHQQAAVRLQLGRALAVQQLLRAAVHRGHHVQPAAGVLPQGLGGTLLGGHSKLLRNASGIWRWSAAVQQWAAVVSSVVEVAESIMHQSTCCWMLLQHRCQHAVTEGTAMLAASALWQCLLARPYISHLGIRIVCRTRTYKAPIIITNLLPDDRLSIA